MMERQAVCTARVAIIAGMWPLETRVPVNVPMKSPRNRQKTSVTQMFDVAFNTRIESPEMMPTCEPTEMSICPAQMTIVMPSAMMPVGADCTKILEMFVQRKKLGLKYQASATSIRNDSQ